MDGTLVELGNGKYRCRISFIDEYGKRIQKSKTFKATGKKEARTFMKEFKDECIKNVVPVTLNTLSDLYNSFVEYHCSNLQDNTVQQYNYAWKLLKQYHNTKLNTIKPNVIKKMLEVAEQNSRSQKGVYQLLTAMYGYANRSELLNYNPCTNVKAPKYKTPEKKILSDEQKQRLNSVIDTQPEKYKVIYILTLTLGFRREEVCALKWQDVDFDNKVLHINRTAVILDGRGTVVKETGKTQKSKSPLPLTNNHIKLLKNYKKFCDEDKRKNKIESDFLFYRQDGNVVNVQYVSQWFKQLCRNNGIENVTFHSLRHTCATDMLQKGVDIATVAAILRDTIETVAKTYLHTDEKAKREAVELIY